MIGGHRADTATTDGVVVELQHSWISVDPKRERERLYRNMVWIFDSTQAHEEQRLDVRTKRDHVTFQWKHPRKSIAACRRLVLLDLGKQLLRIRRSHVDAPVANGEPPLPPNTLADWMRGPRVAA